MHIKFDINGTLEVDVNPIKKTKRKKQDDFDYNDPMLVSFEGEDELVEIEPNIANFFVYKGRMNENPKKIVAKYKKNKIGKTNKPIETIFCLQNYIYEKVVIGNVDELEIFEFLVFDLILNNDCEFKLLRALNLEILENYFAELDLHKEYVKYADNNKAEEKLIKILEKNETYNNSLIIFSHELCNALYEFINFKTIKEAFEVIFINKKKYNYNLAKKKMNLKIYELLKSEVKNKRQVGYYMYKYIKSNKIGKFNGFKSKYLCLERESLGSIEEDLQNNDEVDINI